MEWWWWRWIVTSVVICVLGWGQGRGVVVGGLALEPPFVEGEERGDAVDPLDEPRARAQRDDAVVARPVVALHRPLRVRQQIVHHRHHLHDPLVQMQILHSFIKVRVPEITHNS